MFCLYFETNLGTDFGLSLARNQIEWPFQLSLLANSSGPKRQRAAETLFMKWVFPGKKATCMKRSAQPLLRHNLQHLDTFERAPLFTKPINFSWLSVRFNLKSTIIIVRCFFVFGLWILQANEHKVALLFALITVLNSMFMFELTLLAIRLMRKQQSPLAHNSAMITRRQRKKRTRQLIH